MDEQKERVFYWTYCGKPVCPEQGPPYHGDNIWDLISINELQQIIPNLDLHYLCICSMNKDEFNKKEWPI